MEEGGPGVTQKKAWSSLSRFGLQPPPSIHSYLIVEDLIWRAEGVDWPRDPSSSPTLVVASCGAVAVGLSPPPEDGVIGLKKSPETRTVCRVFRHSKSLWG